MDLFYWYFFLGVYLLINFAKPQQVCTEITTGNKDTFDWTVPELQNSTYVEFSVKTANSNKGVRIALNTDQETRNDGMYKISIGVDSTTQCVITSPSSSSSSSSNTACQVLQTYTSFWLFIDVSNNQISLGKKGDSTTLVTLNDSYSGDLRVATADCIGLQPVHQQGATWIFSNWPTGCDVEEITTIASNQVTNDATTPEKPNTADPTNTAETTPQQQITANPTNAAVTTPQQQITANPTTAAVTTPDATSQKQTTLNPTAAAKTTDATAQRQTTANPSTAAETNNRTASLQRTSVNPTTIDRGTIDAKTSHKQTTGNPTTAAETTATKQNGRPNSGGNPGSSKACSSSNACSKKIRDQITNMGVGNSHNQQNRGSAQEMQKLEELQGQLLTALDVVEVNHPLQLTDGDFVVEVAKFDSVAAAENYKFTPGESHRRRRRSETQKIEMKIASGSLTEKGAIGIAAYYLEPSGHDESNTMAPQTPDTHDTSGSRRSQLASGILSFSTVVNGNKESVDVEFTMDCKDVVTASDNEEILTQCGFWNVDAGVWSDEGCRLVEVADQSCSCYCNHTTNFAILMQVRELPQTKHTDVLNYFGKTLGGLSIICLCATIIIYIVLRLTRSLSIKVHTNLCASLTLAFILFITVPGNVANKNLCQAFAVILHYLFLTAFMWMLVEGMILYRKTTANIKPPKFLPFFAFAWGTPIIIVAITAGLRFEQYSATSCWLSSEKGVIWAFIGPVLFVTSANIMILGMVMRTFMNLKVNTDKSEVDQLKTAFRAVAIMTPILGLPWVFGLLVNIHVAFEYLYGILVATQGVFIFICYCLQNAEVKKAFAIKRGKISATNTDGVSSTKMSTLQSRLDNK